MTTDLTDRKIYDVTLAGYFGFGNFGDEMLLVSAVDIICRLGVDRDRICVLSNDPIDTSARLGVDAVNRWRLREVSSTLAESRTLIFPGGGLFQDATSVKSCVYYWGLVMMARRARCGIAMLGQSIGPLSTSVGRALTRSALRRTSYISVRDRASFDLSNKMHIEIERAPDTTFGLAINSEARDTNGAVLINIRPAPRTPDAARAVARLAAAAEADGIELRGAAMSTEDAELFETMAANGEMPRMKVLIPRTADGFAEAARGCRMAVGMRLHFCLFAMMCGLPVVASPYDPKVSSLADELDMPTIGDPCGEKISSLMQDKTLTNSCIGYKKNNAQLRESVIVSFKKGLTASGVI